MKVAATRINLQQIYLTITRWSQKPVVSRRFDGICFAIFFKFINKRNEVASLKSSFVEI